MSTNPNRILILGGGFAGIYTARALEKLLRPDEASITIVNRENYWVYQPMLPEVISGSIGLTNVVSPIRRLCPRTNLVMREVEDIDLKNQNVTISPGFFRRQLQIQYDHLVIALGNVTNFYGMPGLIENAFPFRTLADAMVLRNHLIHVLEEADVEENPELRCKLLTFVVGGGGFSGVELMAELNDFVHAVKKNYLRLRNEPHRCVIVQAGDRILPEMSEGLALFAQKILRKRGVEIILQDKLKAATSERAILASGIEIPCKTLISTVPSTLPSVVQKLDCPKERGKLLVNTGLELQGFVGKVWALGDCASVKTVAGNKVPPTAQHAIREATTAAINIAAAVRGGQRAQFAFEGLGTLGSLGHGAAVAQISGIKVSGLVAWFLWRCIYLMKMPGINRKVRISSDWLLHLLFLPELAQTKMNFESGIKRQHFEPGDVIFGQGDSGDSVYVVEEGDCEVLREKDGKQVLLATLAREDYFGEIKLLSDKTRNATIRARTPMNVLIIPKHDFNKLRQSVPAFGDIFSELAKKRAAEVSAQSQSPLESNPARQHADETATKVTVTDMDEGGKRSLAADLAQSISGSNSISTQVARAPGQASSERTLDNVYFTLTAPPALEPNSSSEVYFWAHTERQRNRTIRRAMESFGLSDVAKLLVKSEGPTNLMRDTLVAIRFTVAGLIIEPREKAVLWSGNVGCASFVVTVPADMPTGSYPALASIRVDNCEVARMDFVLRVARNPARSGRMIATFRKHRRAFASYAAEDRDAVLACIQGMQKAAPWLEVFVDVVTLRSGQSWEAEIYKSINDSDIFYLFWCRHARSSMWVDREWRCAYKSKGLDFIDPVPLESSVDAPPPTELAMKHFNEPLRAYISSHST